MWATSYFLFLSLCRQYGCLLWTLVVLVWDVKSPTCPFDNTHLMTSEWNHWWFQRHEPEQQLLEDFYKTQKLRAQMLMQRSVKWSEMQVRGYRYTSPFFMYLWHAIKPGCLDREITPCLPTNKPPALVSSPLFIIHNLLWCQGQSDSIVMVKGKSGDLELSTRIGNPGTRQTKTWSLTAWILINDLKRSEELEKVTVPSTTGQ